MFLLYFCYICIYMNMVGKLTIKQEKFCNKYLECGNASEAYRYAYDCSRMREKTIWEKASRLLANDKVRARIKELQRTTIQELNINKTDILRFNYDAVNADILDYLSIRREKLKDEAGKDIGESTALAFKNIETLPKDKRRLIQSLKIDRFGCPIIELVDKNAAALTINKMLGFDAPVKNEHSGPDGAPIPVKMDYSSLSDGDLLTANQIIQKALNGSDK